MQESINRRMRTISLIVVALLAWPQGQVLAQQVKVPGATLRVTIKGTVSDEQREDLVTWVRDTANSISLVYGRFPYPSPNIVLNTNSARNWSSNSAVTFGRVTRNNGGTVELFVNPARPIDEFYADWTAMHEFSHLMLPLLETRHRWISEGLATYYQNVLMARAGNYSEEMAWQKLLEGFQRGQESSPQLSPNTATANGMRGARMKIYWSGAAIALMADIELRRRSDGAQSLDSILGELQACCVPARRVWSGPRLFRQLDEFLEEPLFMPLYETYADRPGYPEPEGLLQQLGVSLRLGTINLDNKAELAGIRQQLMR